MAGVEQRRRLLRWLGAAGLALPFSSAKVRGLAGEALLGRAVAQAAEEPTLFVELDLRIQMDLVHVMVPPSIARYQNRVVGSVGQQLPMFAPQSELKEYPNEVFLTKDSLELAPHIDSVAMLDTGQPPIGGVHGMEAAGGTRSPGRVMDGGASGLEPMWLADGEHASASEELYGNVPTPATFHNYFAHKSRPAPLNGYAFKGIEAPKYSCYHFAAGLKDADLTRIKSLPALLEAFSPAYANAVGASELAESIRAHAMPAWVKRGGSAEQTMIDRYEELARAALSLSEEEIGYWSEGVPPQLCSTSDAYIEPCGPDVEHAVNDGFVKGQIWEQFAYASKLLRAGVVRSVALEFSGPHLDGDGTRTETVQRQTAQQVARPLARFITQMKAAGLYERTVIAVYLVDGCRGPAANNYSDGWKGTVLLAGGRVKGGYYGDLAIQSDLPNGAGHTYAFRTPQPATGAPGPLLTNWNDHALRTPDASVWRAVAKAMGIPESEYVGKFSKLLDAAAPLDCLLRS